MAQKTAKELMGEGELTSSPDDHFIDNLHVRLINCGIRTTSAKRIGSFMVPTFLAIFKKRLGGDPARF